MKRGIGVWYAFYKFVAHQREKIVTKGGMSMMAFLNERMLVKRRKNPFEIALILYFLDSIS